MLRPIRRALRQWRREFSAFWGRFNTFRRMVIGIAFAMAIVYGGRRALLDRRVSEVKKLAKELADKSVPDAVPDPAGDDEVANAEIKTANLKDSLAEWRAKVAEAKNRWPQAGEAAAVEMVTRLDRLLARHRLVVYRRTEEPDRADCPLPSACHRYEAAGAFAGVVRFLGEVAQLTDLCVCDEIRLEVPDATRTGTPAGSGEPLLRLAFRFTIQHP